MLKSILTSIFLAQWSLLPAVQVQAATPKVTARQAFLMYFQSQAASVQTVDDADQSFFRYLNAADRATALAAARTLAKMPSVKVKNEQLVIEHGSQTVTVQIVGDGEPRFIINKNSWTYDPKLPIKAQVDALAAKMATKSAWNWLWPEAHADPVTITTVLIWVTTALIGAGIGAMIGPVVTSGMCALIDKRGTWLQPCSDLRRTREESMLKDAPAGDAVINMSGSDKKNIISRWESEDVLCPSNNDGKPREYRGRIRTIELKDGGKTPLSDWMNVSYKFTANGVPTDIVVTSPGVEDAATLDVNSAANAAKLEVHVSFDPTTLKPVNFRVRNSEYKSGSLLSKPLISLNGTMALSPVQQEMVANAKDMVRFLNFRIYNCLVKDTVAVSNRGQDPGSPAEPKKEPVKATQ